ncbi:hypothetical protein COB55_04405 [Candidatus Wolfebacteria bacterium]|nr:MAG: hypothetical protein COB55_04405 [Candidatus Wolfebacteria bacterium]
MGTKKKRTFKKQCIQCKKEFDCLSNHPNTKTCSRKCLSDYKKSDEYKMNTNKSGRKKKIRIKKCEICNKDFDPGRHEETKTCSKECLSILVNKPEYIEKKVKTMVKTNNEKHGVDFTSQIDGHKEKIAKTWEDKSDEEKEDITIRRVETHNNKSEEEKQNIKDRRDETKIHLYGDKNYNNREQSIETCLEKYGTEHYLSSDQNKELLKNKALEKIEELFKLNDLELIDKYIGKSDKESNKKIYYTIKCLKCDNEFKSTIDFNKLDDNTQEDGSITICRKCYPIHSNSKIQRDFIIFLDTLGIKYEEGVRNLISPFEIDIYLPDYNLGIELNGNYWHSFLGGGKSMSYHINKTKLCHEQGIKLIHIFEDEWLFKSNIIKSMIINGLGLIKNKIYGRNCIIKEITNKEKKKFINENHIQGDGVDKIRLGLFNNDDLFSVMTFSKENRSHNGSKNTNIWELSRFCSKKDYVITGSFSKLLKHFIKVYNPEKISTFADIRWSGLNVENTVYFKSKFNFEYNTNPNYWYVDKGHYLKRTHRFSNRKSQLIKRFGDKFKNNTEWEIAQLNNMDKIWDCGSMKFILTL